jgi:predicted MPP superfamily phosphohydrolase
MIASLKPDMVVFLGDIVDGEIGPVMRGDLLGSFSCPPCRDGVYAITGNHEYIGGYTATTDYIRSKGIHLIEDEVIKTSSGITLIGRKDRDSQRYSGITRATLSELVERADTSTPLILLDHQPYNLDESVSAGIDLHLSGHTHNGQIWPISMLVSAIYEIPYGYENRSGTSFIVSSGFGLWGPRVRIGSRPEVVLINLRFGK